MSRQRIIYCALSSFCMLLLGFGLYLQYGLALEPCPLCIFQRVAYVLVAMICGLAAIHSPQGWGLKLYHCLVVAVSGLGMAIAGRQVWLQYLPKDQIPECGPELGYMLDIFPLLDVLKMVFSGSGKCAEVQWQFIGLSIAEWSLLNFAALLVIGMIMLIWNNRIFIQQ